MKTVIEFNKCVTDFDKLESSDLNDGVKILVYSDISTLLSSSNIEEAMIDDTIFGLWIECGEKTLMMNVSIDKLELFASSVLKHIEIIQKSYGDQIKVQHDMGCVV